MKSIEIEKLITEYLEKNPITIHDLFNRTKYIKSYEQYIFVFDSIHLEYKSTILEFSKNAHTYITTMSSFISELNKIASEGKDDVIFNYINDNFSSHFNISYNRVIRINTVFFDMLPIDGESSNRSLIIIYKDSGYNSLINYINLLNSPHQFNGYTNTLDTQEIAFKYLLFKTNHHSNSPFKRDLTAKNLHQMAKNDLDTCIASITEKKDDFVTYMNAQKEEFLRFFEDQKNTTNNFMTNSETALNNLKKTYEEHLKIAEPSAFMLEQSKKYRNSLIGWSLLVVLLGIILLVLLGFIISPNVTFDDTLITVNILSTDMPIYSSLILLSMISLIIYILRIFIKMAISSKHLMEEYKQKYSLTYFYLSLVNNGNIEDKQSQNIILTSLFTKADTGLLKNENSNDLEKNILSLLNQK